MIHTPTLEETERYAPTRELVDALGFPLRPAPLHEQGTFSNVLPTEPPTFASLLRAMAEIGAYRFRSKSLEWFERRR